MIAVGGGHVDSWYARTQADSEPFPALAGDIASEVAIVGGGLAGLTTGLELARRGRRVTVLEAARIGFGASGRNGGFVGPGWATGLDEIAAQVGMEDAAELWRMSAEGVDIVRDNAQALGLGGALTHGKLSVMRHHDPAGLRARSARMAGLFGYQLETVARPELHELLRSQRYDAALLDHNAFHFHPLDYAVVLAREIVRLGGTVLERSLVQRVVPGGTGHRLFTSAGSLQAEQVVIACGGYTQGLVASLDHSYIPIATYVLLTEPAPELIAQAVRTPMAVSDGRRAGDYYRLVDGGRRLLWGGRITTRTSDPADLAQRLKRTMVATYPQLAAVGIEAAWSGLMAYARHLMPLLGQLRPGLWYCYGFGGHGLNTTAIAGRVMAEALAGESNRIERFRPFGLVWNGGAFGRAAVQLTYWKLQAQDAWTEWRRPALARS